MGARIAFVDSETVVWTKDTQGNISAEATGSGGGPPEAHAESHENGGSDEINVSGLSGLLADGQTPLAHATSHEDGGSDELNIIPATVLTVADETTVFPQSRRLLAGTGVTFDDTTPGQRTVNASSGDVSQVLATIAFLNSEIETGSDVTTNRYIVPFDWLITSVRTVAKTPPSGGQFLGDILFSVDEGANWDSIFNPGDGTHIVDGDYSGEEITFAEDEIPAEAWIRIDVSDVNDALGVTIEIIGVAA